MKRTVSAVLVALLAWSCNPGLGPSEEVVVLSDSDLNLYVSELNRRLTAWYGSSPIDSQDLSSVVNREITFVAEKQQNHPYCYFSSGGNVIVFDPLHKDSGCMPHEIGHWALRRAGHPGWCNFEHPGEEDRQCY